MERQEILIRFADLRRLASDVPSFLGRRSGETTTPSLRTELENELSIAGYDLVEAITEFAEAYRIDVAAFDFRGLISPEGIDSWDTIWFFPLAAYFLAGWLLKTVVSLLCWPFDSQLARRIWQQQVPAFWQSAASQSQPKPLNIGDFVASAAVGQFVRREQVYFRLVR